PGAARPLLLDRRQIHGTELSLFRLRSVRAVRLQPPVQPRRGARERAAAAQTRYAPAVMERSLGSQVRPRSTVAGKGISASRETAPPAAAAPAPRRTPAATLVLLTAAAVWGAGCQSGSAPGAANAPAQEAAGKAAAAPP